MTKIGYARVSTTDQDLTIQIEVLKAAGCEVIRAEKVSGTSTEGRAELATVLDFLRAVTAWSSSPIDRLARSISVQTICGRSARRAPSTTEYPSTPPRRREGIPRHAGVFVETNLREHSMKHPEGEQPVYRNHHRHRRSTPPQTSV